MLPGDPATAAEKLAREKLDKQLQQNKDDFFRDAYNRPGMAAFLANFLYVRETGKAAETEILDLPTPPPPGRGAAPLTLSVGHQLKGPLPDATYGFKKPKGSSVTFKEGNITYYPNVAHEYLSFFEKREWEKMRDNGMKAASMAGIRSINVHFAFNDETNANSVATQVEILIKLAKKNGVTLKLSDDTIKYLNIIKPERQQKIMAQIEDLKANQALNGSLNAKLHARLTAQLDATGKSLLGKPAITVNGVPLTIPTLQDVAADATGAKKKDLKDYVENVVLVHPPGSPNAGNRLDKDDKLKAIQGNIEKIEERLSDLENIQKELNEKLEHYREALGKDPASSWAIDDASKDNSKNPADEHLKKLIEAAQKEYQDLKLQHIAYQEAFNKGSYDNNAPAPPAATLRQMAAAAAVKDPTSLTPTEKLLVSIDKKVNSDNDNEPDKKSKKYRSLGKRLEVANGDKLEAKASTLQADVNREKTNTTRPKVKR